MDRMKIAPDALVIDASRNQDSHRNCQSELFSPLTGVSTLGQSANTKQKQEELKQALEQQILEKKRLKEQEKLKQLEHDKREEQRIQADIRQESKLAQFH